jgi:hypothetical protein
MTVLRPLGPNQTRALPYRLGNMRNALFLLLAGCGTSSGFLRDAANINQHQYRQEVGAVRYSRSVFGTWTSGAVLCIIPVGLGDGPYKEAMSALHQQANLQTNQVLENIREDHSFAVYLFYCTSTVTVSADVIDLLPSGAQTASTDGTKDAPPTPNAPECNKAYADLGGMLRPFRKLYGGGAFSRTPDNARFLTVCAKQPETVQHCLDAEYLGGNIEECRTVFGELPPVVRKRIFSTFLDDYEE